MFFEIVIDRANEIWVTFDVNDVLRNVDMKLRGHYTPLRKLRADGPLGALAIKNMQSSIFKRKRVEKFRYQSVRR